MASIPLTWTQFKEAVDERSLIINYLNIDGNYMLYAYHGAHSQVELSCVVPQDEGADVVDFESNYQGSAILI